MDARLRSWLRALARRLRFERAMDEELRFHVEAYAEDLERQGLSPEDARRQARLAFGNLENVKDDCRQSTGLRLVDECSRQLRFAGRLLRRSPAFTASAVATLAVCLGANLVLFAVVDGVLIRPLPFPDPGRLVRVFNTYPEAGVPDDGATFTNYYERRGRIAALSSLAIYRPGSAIVGDAGATMREDTLQVSPGFFETLGVAPALGRTFTDEEMTPGANDVAIVDDMWWRRDLGGDPSAVGRTIRVDGATLRIVGVLPPGFRFLSSEARIFLPLASSLARREPKERHSGNSMDMLARLAPGATPADAELQLAAQNTALADSYPGAAMIAASGFRTVVVPLRADYVAAVRPVLLLLEAGGLFLLLVGVVNLVNLLLVRAQARGRELAVRQAMGASRRAIVAQVLVETTMLTTAGSVCGLGLAAFGLRLLTRLGIDRLPLGTDIAFNSRLALAGVASALALGILMGWPTAWHVLRRDPGPVLKEGGRGTTSGRAVERARRAFLVAQVAATFTLLAGAGLLGLSLQHAMAVVPGYRVDHVLVGHMTLPATTYPNGEAILAFDRRLIDELRRTPGISEAGLATNVPLSGQDIRSAVAVEGYVQAPGQSPRAHFAYGVDGDYFRSMGLTTIAGRTFDAEEGQRTPVCVVDQAFARMYFPGADALGHRLYQGPRTEGQPFTIIGVVATVRQTASTTAPAQGSVFFPFAGRLDRQFWVIARTAVPPASVSATIERTVRSLDADLPVSDVTTLAARVSDSLSAERSPAIVTAAYALVAVLLSAIGIYGVVAFAVAERRPEIALRLALGAGPAAVRRQFLGYAWRVLVPGMALGLAGAWLVGQGMRSLLVGVAPFSPSVVALTAIVTAATAFLASLIPAIRASRVRPGETLIGR